MRIAREAELLGGQLAAYHTREALVVEASFLREDISYFTELLAEVISQTRYSSKYALLLFWVLWSADSEKSRWANVHRQHTNSTRTSRGSFI